MHIHKNSSFLNFQGCDYNRQGCFKLDSEIILEIKLAANLKEVCIHVNEHKNYLPTVTFCANKCIIESLKDM